MKIVFIMMLAFLMVGCGKSSSNSSKPKRERFAEPLYGKTFDEVVSLKYDEMIINCDLRLQESEIVDLKKKPTKTFRWLLPADKEKKININVKFGLLEGKISYELKKIDIYDAASYSTDDGSTYEMQHSPVVTVHSNETLRETSGILQILKKGFEFELFENVGDIHRTEVTTIDGYHPHLIDLRCSLNTKIKPEYKDQFVKVK